MISALALWVAVIILGHYMFPEDRLYSLSPFLILLAIHIFEVPTARKIGIKKNLSAPRTIIKTLLFGFTWWVPLNKGIIDPLK